MAAHFSFSSGGKPSGSRPLRWSHAKDARAACTPGSLWHPEVLGDA